MLLFQYKMIQWIVYISFEICSISESLSVSHLFAKPSNHRIKQINCFELNLIWKLALPDCCSPMNRELGCKYLLSKTDA